MVQNQNIVVGTNRKYIKYTELLQVVSEGHSQAYKSDCVGNCVLH